MQMHTEDGSPLPLDHQLRLSPNLSSFLSLPFLLCDGNVLSRIPPLHPPRHPLPEPISS